MPLKWKNFNFYNRIYCIYCVEKFNSIINCLKLKNISDVPVKELKAKIFYEKETFSPFAKIGKETLKITHNIPYSDWIFNFAERHVFIKNIRTYFTAEKDLFSHVRAVIDLETSKIYLNRKGEFELFETAAEFLEKNKNVVSKYLSEEFEFVPFFYAKEWSHIGHAVTEQVAQIDAALEFCNSSLVPQKTKHITQNQWKSLFKNCIFYRSWEDLVYLTTSEKALLLFPLAESEVMIFESWLQERLLPRNLNYTFSAYNNLEEFKNINNKEQLVLVTKYDNRHLENQVEVFKSAIKVFKDKIKRVALVKWIAGNHDDLTKIKFDKFDALHNDLVSELNLFCKNLQIELKDLGVIRSDDAKKQLHNSLFYIATAGSTHEIIHLMTNSPGLVHGIARSHVKGQNINPIYGFRGALSKNVTELPENIITHASLLSEEDLNRCDESSTYSRQVLTNGHRNFKYTIDIELFENFLKDIVKDLGK